MTIEGRLVKLRPMTATDKLDFFRMATQSDATPFLYGELQGNKIPTWEELFDDFKDHFFDGSKPEQGRCFAIMVDGSMIGQVNYNVIDHMNNSTELDIWIANDADTGKGYGSDALKTLMRYLSTTMEVERFWICPSVDNTQAIKAYQKAGFTTVETSVDRWGKKALRMETARIHPPDRKDFTTAQSVAPFAPPPLSPSA